MSQTEATETHLHDQENIPMRKRAILRLTRHMKEPKISASQKPEDKKMICSVRRRPSSLILVLVLLLTMLQCGKWMTFRRRESSKPSADLWKQSSLEWGQSFCVRDTDFACRRLMSGCCSWLAYCFLSRLWLPTWEPLSDSLKLMIRPKRRPTGLTSAIQPDELHWLTSSLKATRALDMHSYGTRISFVLGSKWLGVTRSVEIGGDPWRWFI